MVWRDGGEEEENFFGKKEKLEVIWSISWKQVVWVERRREKFRFTGTLK